MVEALYNEGGVLAPNGMIYFTPYNATQILQLDPTTDITSLIGSIYNGTSKWHGGVLAPNGMIYFAQETIHRYKLDSATNQTNLIGSIYNGSAKYAGGVLAPNGIYFAPLVSGKILELNTTTNLL
jgi:streptogramin lyase